METENNGNIEEKVQTPEKSKKSKITQILIIGAVSVVLLVGPTLLAGDDTVATGTTDQAVFSVRAQNASRQTLNTFLDVNGDIISTVQADVLPDVGGILVSVRVNLGTYVRQGEVIAEVDPSRPGMTYRNSPVNAPISGYISRTPLSTGTTVGMNTAITTISLNQNLEISARIPERDIAGLEPGLKAQVSLQAYPGESFSATVIRVSPVVDSISRTKLINLSFDEDDPRINAGMFARLRLNTQTLPDIITVPAEAVLDERGTNVVYVVLANNTQTPVAARREVSVGIILQGWTEITEGLNENEVVIVQGQQLLSGGEALRIIGAAR